MKTPEKIKRGLEYLSIRDIVHKMDMWKEGIAYDYAEDAAADALAYIRQLEAQVPRWISVGERLPDDRTDVAIIYEHGDCQYMRIGWIRPSGEWLQAGLGVIEGKVTHWMQLPEPPKENDHEAD